MPSADDYIDKTSREILQIYNDTVFRCLSLHDLCIKMDSSDTNLSPTLIELKRQGYLEIDPDYALLNGDELKTLNGSIAPDVPLRITYIGRKALEKELRDDHRYLKTEKRAFWAFWISVAAVIISILSIATQIYIAKASQPRAPEETHQEEVVVSLVPDTPQ